MKRVINFVKLQKVMLPVILVCILACIWTAFLPKSLPLGPLTPKNFNVGIDFQGGVSQRITIYSGASIEEIRALAEQSGLGNNVQEVILNEKQKLGNASSFLIKTGLTDDDEKKLEDLRKTQPDLTPAQFLGNKTDNLFIALSKKFGDEYRLTGSERDDAKEMMANGAKIDGFISETEDAIILKNAVTDSVNTVSPASSKGMRMQAIALIAFVLIVMMLYITIRFKIQFAIAAVLALVHDTIICCGITSFTGIELDLTIVAAILTVIGYSINDTIVIFDRVREINGIMKDSHPDDIFNIALSQTLNRTIITSLTTLFTVVALFIFGGSNIKGFALVLIAGIACGTISTLFLASAVAINLEKLFGKERIKKLDEIRDKEEKKAQEMQAAADEAGESMVENASTGDDIAISKKTMMKLMGKKK